VKAFHFVEDHDRAIFACWTLAGTACANVAIDAGQFGMWIHFGIGFHIFAGQGF
jgi:hypothetical protein